MLVTGQLDSFRRTGCLFIWRGPCSETPTSGVQSKRLLTPIGLLQDMGSFTTSGAAGALRINQPSRPFGRKAAFDREDEAFRRRFIPGG